MPETLPPTEPREQIQERLGQEPPATSSPALGHRDIDYTADEMARKRMLPKPPGRKISFDEAQEWFKLLTPEMWNHVVLYIYRDHPRILRQLANPDNPRYSDCLSQPVDMEYMIEHHGGGRYTLMACDTDVKFKAIGNRLFECIIEINPSQHEPKLNYDELDVNAKQNMAYVSLLQYRGILDSKGHPMAPQPNTAAAANSDIVKEVLSFVSQMNADQQNVLRDKISANNEQSLNKSVGEILLEKMKQDDPNKHLVGLLGIIREVLATTHKPAAADNGHLFEKMLQMQAEHSKTVLALFEKVTAAVNQKPEPAPNPQMEQFEQLLNMAERLAGRASGRGVRTGWDIGLDYAKELGAPLLQTIGNIIGLRTNGRPIGPVTGPGAAPAAPPPPPAAFDPYANPAAMRAHSQAMNIPAPAFAAPAAAAPPQNELHSLIATYGGLVVQHLNSGTSGAQFADLIAGLLGNGMHAQICAQGEPALLQAMLTVPEVALFGEPHLRKFVHEFAHYQEFLEPEDQDQDEPDPLEAPIYREGARA